MNKIAVLWDLNGCLVHNNKSLGTGDLPEGYGSSNPEEAIRAYEDGVFPRAYYLTCEDDVVWIDGALEALSLITKAGIDQYIITNQEHIGLGITSPTRWENLLCYMNQQIIHAGGCVLLWYWCPHAPGEGCNCRKRTENPGLKLFYQCAIDNHLNLYDTYMVGDNISDMVAGKMAGCQTIMVKTPKVYPPTLIAKFVDHVVNSALAAAKIILAMSKQ